MPSVINLFNDIPAYGATKVKKAGKNILLTWSLYSTGGRKKISNVIKAKYCLFQKFQMPSILRYTVILMYKEKDITNFAMTLIFLRQ